MVLFFIVALHLFGVPSVNALILSGLSHLEIKDLKQGKASLSWKCMSDLMWFDPIQHTVSSCFCKNKSLACPHPFVLEAFSWLSPPVMSLKVWQCQCLPEGTWHIRAGCNHILLLPQDSMISCIYVQYIYILAKLCALWKNSLSFYYVLQYCCVIYIYIDICLCVEYYWSMYYVHNICMYNMSLAVLQVHNSSGRSGGVVFSWCKYSIPNQKKWLVHVLSRRLSSFFFSFIVLFGLLKKTGTADAKDSNPWFIFLSWSWGCHLSLWSFHVIHCFFDYSSFLLFSTLPQVSRL